MTVEQAVALLKEYNEWRRGSDAPQSNPKDIGIAIDLLCEFVVTNLNKRK